MTAFVSSQYIIVHIEHRAVGGFMAEKFLRLDQVRERTGLCRSAVYGLEGFPRPVKLGTSRAVAWVASEVDTWVDAQIAARHTQPVGAV